jgi:membrane-associated phospholipid phosphatase
MLLSWDRALGFDFRSYLGFVNAHPNILLLLAPSYGSITWQLIAMALILPLAGYYRRIGQAICAFTCALVVTIIISIFVPALGVYGTLGLTAADYPYFEPQGYYDALRDTPLLRAGTHRALDLWKLGGVLTFPSFHAAAAALYIWAFWPLRWLRSAAVIWNLAMIAATPFGGGHYLVDILAGILVAVLAIVAAHILSGFLPPAPPGTTEWSHEAAQRTSVVGSTLQK